MSSIMVFDTETTDLQKPFCYNIGYVIIDTDTFEMLEAADYVVEQVWHNPMLFSTAYYADKREAYIKSMKSHQTFMKKYGHICQQMIRDIKKYDVVGAYAYNSSFDERVFNFNCDWFKCNNPFDNVPIYDIRGYAHHFLCDNTFKKWCEKNEKFSESGNYSTTAENIYQYITSDLNFVESHTALADSLIELEILATTMLKGAKLGTDYKAYKTIPRKQIKMFKVKWNGDIVFEQECETIRYYKTDNTVNLRG